jgi:hypothetical protein
MFRPFSAIFNDVFQYLPEDSQKRPKHAGVLLYDCILSYKRTSFKVAEEGRNVYRVSYTIAYLVFGNLPEDGRKSPKYEGDLLHDCILLYLTVVQFMEETLYNYLTARNMDSTKFTY